MATDALPPLVAHESEVFTRARFDELLRYDPRPAIFEIRIDDLNSVFVTREPDAHVLFVRRLIPRGVPAQTKKDYLRVAIYDRNGALWTTATGDAERAFADEQFKRIVPLMQARRV